MCEHHGKGVQPLVGKCVSFLQQSYKMGSTMAAQHTVAIAMWAKSLSVKALKNKWVEERRQTLKLMNHFPPFLSFLFLDHTWPCSGVIPAAAQGAIWDTSNQTWVGHMHW